MRNQITPWETLESVWEQLWLLLDRGAVDTRDPFHQATLASLGDGYPDLRTVILRFADRPQRLLACHSDRRAQKIEQLQQDPTVSWLLWHPRQHVQLRCYGQATVHLDDEVAEEAWQSLGGSSRRNYSALTTPGSPIKHYKEGIEAYDGLDSVQGDRQASWRPHFCTIHTHLTRVEWLLLERAGHRRARFDWDGQQWESQWLVP